MLYSIGSHILYPAYYYSRTMRWKPLIARPELPGSTYNNLSSPRGDKSTVKCLPQRAVEAGVGWTFTKEDEDRVQTALVESMLDWKAEQSDPALIDDQNDPKSTEKNAQEGIEAERRPTEEGVGIEDAPSQPDAPFRSPSSAPPDRRDPVDDLQEEAADVSMAASTSLRQLRPAAAPSSAPALNEPPRRRPLSTLSLFSRHTPVCLSATTLTPKSDTESLAAAAKDGAGAQYHAHEEEPNGRERELVERVFGGEARRVEREVERAVASDRGVAVPEADEVHDVVDEGATYFRDGMTKSFADVDLSAGVDTQGFCEACEGLSSWPPLRRRCARGTCWPTST
ncbi:hypothetical protein JCM1841_002999 [Sporobolomyces salmonicolor]